MALFVRVDGSIAVVYASENAVKSAAKLDAWPALSPNGMGVALIRVEKFPAHASSSASVSGKKLAMGHLTFL
jgi:hypothetical protein